MRWALLAALLVVGCGPKAGDKYGYSGTVYYDKADAERGGPPNRDLDLSMEHKATFLGGPTGMRTEVEVIEPGQQWTKIKSLNGSHPGTEGWVETKRLEPLPEP